MQFFFNLFIKTNAIFRETCYNIIAKKYEKENRGKNESRQDKKL